MRNAFASCQSVLRMGIAAILMTVLLVAVSGCGPAKASDEIVGQWELSAFWTSERGFEDLSPGKAIVGNNGSITLDMTEIFGGKMTGTWETIPKEKWPDVPFEVSGLYKIEVEDSGGQYGFLGIMRKYDDGTYTLLLYEGGESPDGLLYIRKA